MHAWTHTTIVASVLTIGAFFVVNILDHCLLLLLRLVPTPRRLRALFNETQLWTLLRSGTIRLCHRSRFPFQFPTFFQR